MVRDDQTHGTGDAWVYIDEITHRTMNDYTAMLASVQYAATKVRSSSVRGVLKEVAHRLNAQASAHRLLRPPRESGPRRLDVDLAMLCASLSSATLCERGIELTLICDTVFMEGRRAWQTSLIISELVMNAVRHAFEEGEAGEVIVEVRPDEGALHCLVSDNGRAQFAWSPGGGTVIVDALVADLGGRVSRSLTSSGSTICVTLPLSAQGEAARASIL